MKPARRLGRGLEDLVPLAPASADGTARLDDALRGGPSASVLALSGRSVEDFVREEARAAPPTAAPAPAASAPPAVAPAVAPTVQFDLFDPPLPADDAACEAVTEAVETALPPAPPVPNVSAPSRPAPAPPASPPPPPIPVEEPRGGMLLLDDEVGGIVLPDVELE